MGLAARLLVLLALWFLGSAHAADPARFENSPVRDSLVQQEMLRIKAKEEQDRHRLRIALPGTALDKSLGQTNPAVGSAKESRPSDANPETAITPGTFLLRGTLICLIALLVLRRFAPEHVPAFLAHLLPWLSPPSPQTESSAETLAEEKAFSDFLVAFRLGPSARPKIQNVGFELKEPSTLPKGNGVELERQKEVSKTASFLSWASEQLTAMRNALHGVQRHAQDAVQRQALRDLRTHFRALIEAASLPEVLPIWQVASVTEGFVGQLIDRTPSITPGMLRTIANGLDLLIDLCKLDSAPDFCTNPPIRILAVDDDLISRHAVGLALKKAFNQPDIAANGEAALAQASMISYDVIFLDIMMPGLNGFELCSKIRETALNKSTPVVFVTALSDFDTRAKSNLCGGQDFITKPFLTFDITVKALVLALRGRLEKRGLKPALKPRQPLQLPEIASSRETDQKNGASPAVQEATA
jgi:CheY-like chemotaxis protein